MSIDWITIVCGGSALACSLVATPAVAALSSRMRLFDEPGPRKVHARSIPRLGGVAIGLATLFPLAFFILSDGASWGGIPPQQLVTLIISAAMVWLVGFIDDIYDLPAKYKMLVLAAAAAALCGSGATIDATISRGGFIPDLGWFSWPLTILWLITIPVAINFIDGLDGLAAGIGGAAAVVTGIGLAAAGQPVPALILCCLAAALAGFLVYNRYPAKIFMGDSGSMFTGYLLAGVCVISGPKVGVKTSFLLPAVVLVVPLIDTMLTFVRRGVLQRRSIFSAERGHVHHRLLDMGLSHRQAVWVLYAVTLAAAVVGVLSIFTHGLAVLGSLALLVPLVLGLFRMSGSVRGRETLSAVRRNLAMKRSEKGYRAAFEEAQPRFREVERFDQWWTQVTEVASRLDLVSLKLNLTNRDGTDRLLTWTTSQAAIAEYETICARIPIRQRRDRDTPLIEANVAIHKGCLESAGLRTALFTRLLNDFNLTLFDERTKRKPLHHQSTNADSIPREDLLPASQTPPGQPKIAIVHDFLYTYAGAERVLEQMLEVYPHADLFSLFDFLPAENRQFIRDKQVRTSFIQKLPFARKRHRAYLPLMPLAIEQLNMEGYDIVLSSSYCVAKGVITRPDQLHICYCHSPVRFAWDMQHQYLSEARLDRAAGRFRALKGALARVLLHYIRIWDVRSANGVDLFLSNSAFVGRRITKAYRRESKILYPPVDVGSFVPAERPRQDFYLAASRMVPYKRMELIVEAFTQMPDRRLIVVGDGPDFEKIKAIATPNVTLVGHVAHDRLLRYLQMAKAFVFAAEEDFGILPVEAMACGTPVLAYRSGGVGETVIDGQTGLFFDRQDVAAITDAVARFEATPMWNTAAIRSHAESFSVERFRTRLQKIVSAEWNRHQQTGAVDLSSPTLATDRPAVGLAGSGSLVKSEGSRA